MFFGLGTIPLMMVLMGARILCTPKFRTFFKIAIPFVLIIVGGLFILRGLGLGVAFVSPSNLSLRVHLIPMGCH
ncbi:hypothetical protein ACXGQW_11225 [Wenyingzhuangia sp. IMCC45533]